MSADDGAIEADMTSAAEREATSGSSVGGGGAHADEKTELTARDITEIDARPFFFRHVTVVVKFCAVLLTAGIIA